MNTPPLVSFRRITLAIGVIGALLAPAARAVTLAEYQFATNLNPTSEDASVTASALGGTGTSRSTSLYAYQYPQPGNSGYMDFTLTADAGYLFDLNQLDFAYYFPQTTGTPATVTATFSVQYSFDGFATAGIALTSPQATYTSTSGALDAAITVGDFAPASYSLASIPDTASISFRIILSNNAALNTAGYRYAIDNLVVSGDVLSVIPEPSSVAALAGIAVLGFVLLRRRPTCG
ncbi:MAG: PEP-CTERM sorting domain-containing protein [Rariglobus sp.]